MGTLSGDGYYQEWDEFFCIDEELNEQARIERLEEIERLKQIKRKKREQKNAVKKEVERQLKKAGVEPKPYKPRGKTVEVKCKCCEKMFTARVADRKRGWGKYCSKSCKAINQDKGNPKNRDYYGT